MKALTVCQPFAWAIIHGPKKIENRTWPTDYRGPLAIHAGKSRKWLCPVLRDGTPAPAPAEMAFGAVIGRVKLVACVRRRDPRVIEDPFAEGQWCWVLEDPEPIEPHPWRGKQRLFEVPDEIFSRENVD